MTHHPHRAARQALLALAAAATIGGMAAAPAQAQQLRSASSTVKLDVSVVDGELRLSSASATVPAGVLSITWRLLTPGWRFTAGSIDFGDAASAFSCRVQSEGGSVTCNRSTSAPKGQLAYRVLLSNSAGLTELPQPSVYISLE